MYLCFNTLRIRVYLVINPKILSNFSPSTQHKNFYMSTQVLLKKQIAILVDAGFIPAEINYYASFFTALGAEVVLLTDLQGQPERSLISDIHDPDFKIREIRTITINKDIKDQNPSDFNAVLMAGNYCAIRLRTNKPAEDIDNAFNTVEASSAVQFFAQAMDDQQVIKAAIDLGLYILTPSQQKLKGKTVSCNPAITPDVINAGALPIGLSTVVDGDLITTASIDHLKEYCYTISQQILKKDEELKHYTMNN